jgi:protein-S-isoprenylcysteine O-methyltransferase Ste14
MRATALEFRLRMYINTAIIVLGVWAPWIAPARRVLMMEWLPLELARLRLVPFSAAVPAVLAGAAILAALGAILRVSGTAYLGPATVIHPDMKASAIVANGPYRYVRNPLYIGLGCMVAAMALVMPPSGAALSLVLLAVFLLRLTLGEEAFLSAGLGDPYRAYLAAVPRFLPRLRTSLPRSAARPQWARAFVAELTPIGVFIAIVILFWDYNVDLVARIILIAFGLSLVTHALMPNAEREPTESA